MSHWKYRAFDALLRIDVGVIVSEDDQPETAILELRQRGLQSIELWGIDAAEYKREIYLQRLKTRYKPQSSTANPTTQPSFFTKLRHAVKLFISCFGKDSHQIINNRANNKV